MATELAEALLERLKLVSAPIDLHAVAASEEPLLVLKSGDYRDRFDGQLEYHRAENRFLLFYNTKYDRIDEDRHRPRTRFSLAHELGHYFIDRHHDYLVRGGSTHGSKSEFFSHVQIEREADAFAAGLLMPTRLMRPMVNSGEITVGQIDEIANHFETSRLSTAIRSVQLSHFPCALIGLRDGLVSWTFLSSSLNEAGCYPRESGSRPHMTAPAAWQRMTRGDHHHSDQDVELCRWFNTYDRHDLKKIILTETYLPAPSMNTLLVLLTADEDDLTLTDEED